MLSTGFLELARKLIATDTVSARGTRQAADLLQTLWEHAGLTVRRQVVEEVHVNLLGGPGGDAPGPGGVLLVTHLDTVPPGPLDKWQSDPWTLTEREGFLYGLGAADVKLDALCKAEAARRLQGRKGRRPFWLLGTFGEEIGLRGARHFVQSELFREVAPAQVLCGEPSELQIISAHKGYVVIRCTIHDRKARAVNTEGPGVEQLQFAGKAAHSSTPHLGENAILKALAWVKASGSAVVAAKGGSGSNVVPASCTVEVPAPREKGDPEPVGTKFLPPRAPQPNLWRALATASALEELWKRMLPPGEDARFDPAGAVGGLNVLAAADGAASIELDARLLPDHDADGLVARFQAEAAAWVAQLGQGELQLEMSVERNASGMAFSSDSPLVRSVGRVLARHGLDPTPRAKPTSTEAGVFARAGCEAIVIGPGRSTGNAHTPNERIEMAQLDKACDLYESLLVELRLYVIRDVQRSDLPGLRKLASELDTVNLPDDERQLSSILEKSARSFDGRIRDPFEREYLFVMEETRSGKLAGSSLIIAQHGTRDAPHIFFDVYEKEHYSHSVDRHFRHRVLSIGYNFDGPTEIGGLVVDPQFRGQGKPGKQLSYVRFLFIAMHRPRFRDRILVELLPRLEDDGRSPLWEALGRKFTGLRYQDADRLSRENKEFIQQLFPPGEIYATIFSQKIQEAIGEVGPESVGAKNMLTRIGFRYDERIDPFDGGPHYSAPTELIEPIRRFRRAKLARQRLPEGAEASPPDVEERLVAIERTQGRNRFRAVRALCAFRDAEVQVSEAAVETLEAEDGARLHTIPFE